MGQALPRIDRSIVLVGLMGAGKSTVGRRLARRLGLDFVDSDEEIERAADRSIPEIFDRFGEACFRDGERRVIARLISGSPKVIATGGGAYMNLAIHNVDLLYWFMGDVAEVCGLTSTLAHERIEVEDVGTAIVKFKNGALGTLEASTAVYPGLLKKTEIHGSEGSAIIEQDSILLWNFKNPQPEDEQLLATLGAGSATTGGAADPKAISFIGHQRQFEDFIKAIETGSAPLIDGHEGRKSVELILAIYKSCREGKRISLPL